MPYIPGLWVPVSAENRRGGAQPAFRWIHPVLARAGHEVFFANALSIMQAFHAPIAIISNIHGLSTAKQENGNRYVDNTREQDFEAYTLAKRAGILQETLMDNEALARVFGRFVEAGCEPIPYVGPWMRSTPPTRDAVAEALEPYINTDVDRIMIDGGGCRNDASLVGFVNDCGLVDQRLEKLLWTPPLIRYACEPSHHGPHRDAIVS